MNMPIRERETATALPSASARILALPPKRVKFAMRISARASAIAMRLVPPVVVIVLALAVWEFLCRKTGATLPPPSRVVKDTWELIVDPFFDRGGISAVRADQQHQAGVRGPAGDCTRNAPRTVAPERRCRADGGEPDEVFRDTA